MDLQIIFTHVKAYQKALGFDFDTMTDRGRMAYFRECYVALAVEQAEFINELPWKPWRPIADQAKGNKYILAKEWVDCLFFLIDQALIIGLDAEILDRAFTSVLHDNLQRISVGYNHVRKDEKEKR